jgi:hypothetical protein
MDLEEDGVEIEGPEQGVLMMDVDEGGEERWKLIPTPNGEFLDESGLYLGKLKGNPRGWNCETRGEVGWSNGIHQWKVLLEDGGSSINLGICLQSIDLSNKKLNDTKIIYLHCATGVCTVNTGAKTKVFEGMLSVGAELNVLLNMDAKTLTFGRNGVWNDESKIEDIGDGPWFPYVGLYEQKKRIKVFF